MTMHSKAIIIFFSEEEEEGNKNKSNHTNEIALNKANFDLFIEWRHFGSMITLTETHLHRSDYLRKEKVNNSHTSFLK